MLTIEQVTFLPEILEGIYLGMPFHAFEEAKGASLLQKDMNQYVSYINEKVDHPKVERVVYQFDRHLKLYEIMVEFEASVDVGHTVREQYGDPDEGNTWFIKEGDKCRYRLWKFNNRLCLADATYF